MTEGIIPTALDEAISMYHAWALSCRPDVADKYMMFEKHLIKIKQEIVTEIKKASEVKYDWVDDGDVGMVGTPKGWMIMLNKLIGTESEAGK